MSKSPSTRWRARKRHSMLLDLGRSIYALYIRNTGDTWWKMSKRSEVSDCVMQRFLGVGEIQKPHNGRALANVEAIFEAMGHVVLPVPVEMQPVIQQIIDDYYNRTMTPDTRHKEPPHGSTTHA